MPSYFALDFGYINDPSAFIHVKIDKDKKKLYIVEEYVKTGMLNDEIANVIKQLGYSKEEVTADSAEQKSIAEIRKLGIERIVPTKKVKAQLFKVYSFYNSLKSLLTSVVLRRLKNSITIHGKR